MEALTSLLKEMEARLQALQADLGKLKRQARLLAEENERLRHELARAYGQDAGEGSLKGGLRNLWDLYQQGFHVCNVHFGRLRVQECLFCEAFWRRERGAAK